MEENRCQKTGSNDRGIQSNIMEENRCQKTGSKTEELIQSNIIEAVRRKNSSDTRLVSLNPFVFKLVGGFLEQRNPEEATFNR